MVRPIYWPRGLCLLLLVVFLTACSPLAGDLLGREKASAEPVVPSPTVIGVPTAEKVNPFPEYRLSLALDPAAGRLVGQQEVTIPNHTGVELQEIVFRLYPNLPQYGGQMDIGPVAVDGEQGISSLRAEDTALVIPLDRPLATIAESVRTADLGPLET